MVKMVSKSCSKRGIVRIWKLWQTILFIVRDMCFDNWKSSIPVQVRERDYVTNTCQDAAPSNAMYDNRGAGMAQWWERSPPTAVSRVLFPDPASPRGLSLLLALVPAPRVFLRVLRFSSLHKNQHKFQFDPEMMATGLSALLLSLVLSVTLTK